MVYNVTFSNESGTVVEFGTGRTSLWEAQDWGMTLPETPYRGIKTDFAWGYFAAKQAGKLDALGIPSDTSVDEAVAMLADAYDVDFDKVQGGTPLAQKPVE